ncbi:MAG: RsmE family RNA methyltransferase [bacterium]
MPKFFITSEDLLLDRAATIKGALIRGEDVHHISHVLRLKAGDEVTVNCDGRMDLRARIETITTSQVRLQVLEQLCAPLQSKYSITLVQGIPKHAKMDLILQKATELGVEDIIPLASNRSFVNEHRGVSEGRWSRWLKICQEAAKQCGRSSIPNLHSPVELTALCSLCSLAAQETLSLLLWEKEKRQYLKSVLASYRDHAAGRKDKVAGRIFILVGPEGGFSEAEVQSALQAGFIPVSCAPWILRTETAALYALSAVQYELNFP